ncbi:MAG: MFS transporter [Lachnospiraceae bacterium]|nr:MFS transporter [Lachnospiraceae bacterium]
MEKSGKGYYGVKVVAVMALMMLPMSLIMNTASIFYTPVTEEFGIPLAAMGLTLTLTMLGSAFGAPFVTTPLSKKIKLRWLIGAALLVEAACFAVRATTSSMMVFYITSVLISIPMGLLCNVSIPIIANGWYPKKPGTAIGIMASTQGLGGMLFSAIGGIIIQNAGWRTCYWVWAAIALVAAPIAMLVIRNEPSEVGQVAPGSDSLEVKAVDPATLPGMMRNNAIKTPVFWIVAVCLILSSFCANVNAYINPYSQSVGMSVAVAGFVSAMIQLGVFVNKIVLGQICDRMGVRAGGIYYTVTAILCFGLILFSGGSTALIMLGCFLIGPLYSSVNLYGPILTRYMFGTKDQPRIWALYVLMFCTFGGSAATIWGLVIGAIGYGGAFKFVAALVAVLLVLLMFVVGLRKNTVAKWETPEAAEAKE